MTARTRGSPPCIHGYLPYHFDRIPATIDSHRERYGFRKTENSCSSLRYVRWSSTLIPGVISGLEDLGSKRGVLFREAL